VLLEYCDGLWQCNCCVWLVTVSTVVPYDVNWLYFDSHILNVASSGHFILSGDLAKLAVAFAEVDIFN